MNLTLQLLVRLRDRWESWTANGNKLFHLTPAENALVEEALAPVAQSH